jgi:ubiquinone/menaquinone biosynthesis C-methylase UbiE
MPNKEFTFWNSPEITEYFKAKPADPRIERHILDHDTDGTRALDLGCGGGRHSELLARAGCDVSSVDVNPAMLAQTARRLESQNLTAEIQYGSILDIPFDDETFDTVITTGVLHQAKSLDEYVRAVAELSRVVKPNGTVLLNIFTNLVWDDTYETISEDGFSVMTREGLPMTLLSKEIFIDLMQKNQFEMFDDQGEDVKEENTGPRAVFRAFFVKCN